jgi:hypothetical protein
MGNKILILVLVIVLVLWFFHLKSKQALTPVDKQPTEEWVAYPQ